MNIFITGARGFVMSVLIQRLLEADSSVRVIAADITEPDQILLQFLDGEADRLQFRRLDVRDGAAVAEAVATTAPEVVVHAATLTHVPHWEQEDPARYVDVNVMGTTRVLDAARRTRSVRKVVHVSSAAVYGTGTQDSGPLSEDAPLLPDEMYGVSKVASELIAQRYSALYDLDIPIVRFTKVFGPMERPSSSRTSMSLPFHLAAALHDGRSARVTERTMQAAGDWVSAVDIADALVSLCLNDVPPSGTYNLASGAFTSVSELIDLFKADVVTGPREASEADMDPNMRYGKNATYSIERAAHDLNWRPRPLSEQVTEYLTWASEHTQCFRTRN